MCLKSLKTFFNKHKIFFISLFIFITILMVLGLPFVQWAPYKDDFGNLFRSQAKSWADFVDFFINGDAEVICSNYRIRQDFLSAYYRPMLFVYTFIQKHFFGFNWYYYYLVMIIIHAINSVLLFNLFLYFVNYLLAFIGALYFAFHPSLNNWLGWFGGLQYHTQLFLFLLMIIFIKKYLDTKEIYFYIISCLSFLISIFSGEPPIVTPIWIILAVYFYDKVVLKNKAKFWYRIVKSIKVSLGFWLILFFYIAVKLYLHPFALAVQKYSYYQPTVKDIFVNKLFNIITCVSDFLNLSFFYCSGQRLLKGFTISLLIFALIFLFFKSKKKAFLLFLFFSIGLFCWPVVLVKYCNRYIYLSLPFFILFVLLCINKLRRNKILIMFSLALILINTVFLFKGLKKQELMLDISDKAFKDLIVQVDVKNYNVSFNDLPFYIFGEGLAQALSIYSNSDYLNNLPKKGSVYVTWDFVNNKFIVQGESEL